MEREKNLDQIPSIYTVSVLGAEEILKKIQLFPKKEKLLLKNDGFFEKEKKHDTLTERMEFFTPERDLENTVKELESLFISEQQEKSIRTEENIQILIDERQQELGDKKGSVNNLFLEIHKNPYRIPFEIQLFPYSRDDIYPREKTRKSLSNQENFTYYTFPPEKYLVLAFYEILNGLELLNDLSWYKEVYEILNREPLEGRKVWEGLRHLLSEHPIPSVEKRMETIESYKNYGYMKKRWKSQSRRCRGHYPQWEQVITLLSAFFRPIFEGVLKDEIFLGDWMPQLSRYLD